MHPSVILTQECTTLHKDVINIISPVSVAIHECELKSNKAIKVRVIVPGRFVQKKYVPVCWDEHQAGEAVERAKHDAQGPFNENNNQNKSYEKYFTFFCYQLLIMIRNKLSTDGKICK